MGSPRVISSHLTSQMPPSASMICWDLVDRRLMGVLPEEVAPLLPATAPRLPISGVLTIGKETRPLGLAVPAEL